MDEADFIFRLKNFLDKDMKLQKLPKKRKLKVYSLFYLISKFDSNKEYTEKEVNEIINSWHTFFDCAMLRRFLYQSGFLDRKNDGSLYWIKDPQPKLEEFDSWIGETS